MPKTTRNDDDDLQSLLSPTKKTRGNGAHAQIAAPEKECFTAKWLDSAAESKLLDRVLKTSSELEALPTGSNYKFAKDFVAKVCSSFYTRHASTEVKVGITCIIADLTRVAAPQQTRGAPAEEGASPIPPKCLKDSITVVLETIDLLRTAKPALFTFIRHALEALSDNNGIVMLLGSSSGESNATVDEDAIDHALEVLLHGAPKCTSAENDDALANLLAAVVGDFFVAQQSASENQLKLLLETVAGGGGGSGGAKSKDQPAIAFARRVAQAVFRANEDLLQDAVAKYLPAAFEVAAEEIHRIDVSGGDDAADERKALLKQLAVHAESIVVLAGASANYCAQLFPLLLELIKTTESAEVRMVVFKGLSRAFLAEPQLIREFPQHLARLVSCVDDAKNAIRVAAVSFLGEALDKFAALGMEADSQARSIMGRLRGCLTDPEEAVRKAAILVVASLPKRLPGVPSSLMDALFERCFDKKPGARALAIEQTAALYGRAQAIGGPLLERLLRKAPSSILEAVRIGSPEVVEAVLPTLLLSPQSGGGDEANNSGGGSPNKKGGKKPAKKQMLLTDFEDKKGNKISNEDAPAVVPSKSFAASLATLARHLDDGGREKFIAFLNKKAKLRQTVFRLLQLREELKNDKTNRVLAEQVGRIIGFLDATTHAKEWRDIFTLKDQKVLKALEALCSPTCSDFPDAVAALHERAHASCTAPLAKFIDRMAALLCLPFSQRHAVDLLVEIKAAREQHAEAVSSDDAPSDRAAATEQLLGAFHALHCIATHSPILLLKCAGPLAALLKSDANRHAASEEYAPILLLEAKLIQEFRLPFLGAGEEDPLAAAMATHGKEVPTVLRDLCLKTTCPKVAKVAARCLCSAAFVADGSSKAQVTALLAAIDKAVAGVADETLAQVPEQAPAWCKVLQIVATERRQEFADKASRLLPTVVKLLFKALHNSNEEDSRPVSGPKARKTPHLSECKSFSALLVETAAKALVAHAVSLTASKRSEAEKAAFANLTKALEGTKHLPTGTVGVSLKRLAIGKQMIKLVALGSASDFGRESAVVVYTAHEDNPYAKDALRRKMAHWLQRDGGGRRGDARLAAILLMTGLHEDSRHGYNTLKAYVASCSDKMRAKEGEVDITDPLAIGVYIEYAIPFLVLHMAHCCKRQVFESESKSHFIGFQRIWHVLFEDILRRGTKGVAFVVDVLRKVKAYEDTLADASSANNARVIADLASKVLMEILSHKSIGVDALKQFPGSILLPNYFKKPADGAAAALDKVYLDKSVKITTQVVFNVDRFVANEAAKRGGGLSPSGSPTRSPALSGDDNDDDDDDMPLTKGAAGKNGRNVAHRQSSLSVSRSMPAEEPSVTPPPKASKAAGAGNNNKKRGRPATTARDESDDESEGGSNGVKSQRRQIAVAQTPSRSAPRGGHGSIVARAKKEIGALVEGMTKAELKKCSMKQLMATVGDKLQTELDESTKAVLFEELRAIYNAMKE